MAKLIGTGTNQVPTNGMLGGMAYQTPEDVTVKKIQENDFNVVTQTDIGTEANQIPTNGMLGNMAYQNAEGFFVPELVATRRFEFYKSDPNSIYSDYDINVASSYVTRGVCQRIGHADSKVYESSLVNYYANSSSRFLISGERFRPSSGGTLSGTSIPLLKFKYRSPYRGTALTTIKYVITADGSYSTMSGELYLYVKDYNSAQTINKTTSAATTRDVITHHNSTGTHYLQYAFLDGIPATDTEGNIELKVYGTGTQYGNYNICYSLDITNLSTMDNSTSCGLLDLAYSNPPY